MYHQQRLETTEIKGLAAFVPKELSAQARIAADIAVIAATQLVELRPEHAQVEQKSPGDYVTDIDRTLDGLITQLLKYHFPDDAVVSEESVVDKLGQGPTGRTWIVDPLDGTSAYIMNIPRSVTIMLTLVENQEATLSVVCAPFRNQLFVAEKGRGAYCNGEQVRAAASVHALREGHVALNRYGVRANETSEFVALESALRSTNGPRLVTVPAPASILGCLTIAENFPEFTAVVHDHNWRAPKQEVWDVLPVQLYVEEAGGYYGDLVGNRYDVWNQRRGPIVVSGSPAIAAEICQLFASTSSGNTMAAGTQSAYV